MNKNLFKKPLSTIKSNNLDNIKDIEINEEFNKKEIENLYPWDSIKISDELFDVLLRENFFQYDKLKERKNEIVWKNLIFNEKDWDLLSFSLNIESLDTKDNLMINKNIYNYQLTWFLNDKIEVLKTNISQIFKIIDKDWSVWDWEFFNTENEAKERIKDFLENEYERSEIDDDLIFSVANFDIQPTKRILKDIKSIIIDDILSDDNNFMDEKYWTYHKHILFEKIKDYTIDQLWREFFDLKWDNFEFVKSYEKKTFEKYINHELNSNSIYKIEFINPLNNQKEISNFNPYENLQNIIYDFDWIKEVWIKVIFFEENSTKIKNTIDPKNIISISTVGEYINEKNSFNINLIKN